MAIYNPSSLPFLHFCSHAQEILAQTYSKSLLSFAEDLLKEHQHFEKPFRMEEALTKSFARLDKDLSREALTKAANEGWLVVGWSP